MIYELQCLCGNKGGTPVWKKCQGKVEHLRKAKENKAMASFIDALPSLKLKPSEGVVVILDANICPTCGKNALLFVNKDTYWRCANCGQDSENYAMLEEMDNENEARREHIENGGSALDF